MEKQKPTVLVVGQWVGTGGVITFQRNLILHSTLDRSGFRQYNLSRIRIPSQSQSFMSGKLSPFCGQANGTFSKIRPLSPETLACFSVELRRVDLVQLQSPLTTLHFWEAAIYLFMAKAQKKPVSMRFGGTFNVFYNETSPNTSLIRYLLTLPDAIIVQSRILATVFCHNRTERLHIMPNAVPIPTYDPHRRPRPQASKPCLSARMKPRKKGVDTVLKVVLKIESQLCVRCCTRQSPRRDRPAWSGVDIGKCMDTFQGNNSNRILSIGRCAASSHYERFPKLNAGSHGCWTATHHKPSRCHSRVIHKESMDALTMTSDSNGLKRLLTLCDQPHQRLEMGAAC